MSTATFTAQQYSKLLNMTTPAWEQFSPHAEQSRCYRSTARFTVVVAGRNSGKTAMHRQKLVRLLPVLKPWPDPIYCYGMPTYNQARRVGWEKILPLIPKPWIKSANKSELCITTIFGSKLYVVGMDKPQRVEGMQVDGFVLDECSDQRPEGYTLTILPMLSRRDGWCARIGVPKRNGIGAVEFRKAFEKGLVPNDEGIESFTWPTSDVLEPAKLQQLIAQMSDKDAEEQFGGIWVDQEGQIFYAYSDKENVRDDVHYENSRRIGVGSDFNVDPMAWILFHYYDGTFRVFDEIWLRDTNTEQTLDELYKRYPRHKAGWTFFGDATAQARKTSASESDYYQIQNDGRFVGNKVRYPKKNPRILDRFAATNAMCKNALGVRRLFINPKCENLRADLQRRTYEKGTREPDDEGDVGHITDALGYPIHMLCPIRKKYSDGQVALMSLN